VRYLAMVGPAALIMPAMDPAPPTVLLSERRAAEPARSLAAQWRLRAPADTCRDLAGTAAIPLIPAAGTELLTAVSTGDDRRPGEIAEFGQALIMLAAQGIHRSSK